MQLEGSPILGISLSYQLEPFNEKLSTLEEDQCIINQKGRTDIFYSLIV